MSAKINKYTAKREKKNICHFCIFSCCNLFKVFRHSMKLNMSSKREASILAIELNNDAIEEIKKGNIVEAFQMLSYACRNAVQKHAHEDTYHRTYQYEWVDCSKSLVQGLDGLSSFNEGRMSFMYLKFLKIEPPVARRNDPAVCACGFAWVLWYNLGIVSALLGSPISNRGNRLLQQALHLFNRVQCIVDPEPLSKHWLVLQLSILNNEACVLSDLSMAGQSLERLIKMGLTLTKTSDLLDPKDQEMFLWTVKTLVEDEYAAAA